jgi:hypothetical protein
MKINSISRKYFLIVFAGMLVLLLLAACTSDTAVTQYAEPVRVNQADKVKTALPDVNIEVDGVDGAEYISLKRIAMSVAGNSPDNIELSEEEANGLIFMREEEKLAHDVYLALYDRWSLPVFQNISIAESTHSDAVRVLIESYGLEDPERIDKIGVFTNPELQELYDQMVFQGSQSLGEALKVGATVEEIDILDLVERLEQTDQADIQRVYENLLNGSSNHVRAFVSTLKRQTGEDYFPQYMPQDTYNAIIQSGIQGRGPTIQGRGFGGGGNQKTRGIGRGG